MTAPAATLTVGVPTFERREIVCRRVGEAIRERMPERAEVLIVDDASRDGTHAALARLCADTTVRVLRNESNRGYAGNLLRLFDECRTPYLLVASDDDAVLTASLAPLTRLLEERSPAFVSTEFRLGERLYRGGHGDGRIVPGQLLAASSHAPGLVYRVEQCGDAVERVRARLGDGCAAAHAYPQVLILADLLLAGRECLWWQGCAVAGEADQRPTGIRDAAGAPYYHLAPRWAQVKDLLDFIVAERPAGGDPAAAAAMAAEVEEGLFWRVRSAIEHERPELLAGFDRRAARFYAGRWRWDRLLGMLRGGGRR